MATLASGDTRIPTALVGYGYAGRTFHAPLIAACSGLRLHTVVSSNPATVHAHWPGVRVVSDLAHALADPQIALVVVATPNHLHADQALQALAARRHVVVDKPFAVTPEQARTLIAAARAEDRMLSVFHNRRWDADFLTLRATLAENLLGHVVHFESRFDRFRPLPRVRWREQAVPGGGVWWDLGPHLVDQAVQLFGLPLRVHGQLRTLREGAQIDDWAQVSLDFGATQATLSASMLVGGGVPRFAVHGTRGSWVKFGLDTQESALLAGLGPSHPDWGLHPLDAVLYGAGGAQRTMPLRRGAYQAFYRQVAAELRGEADIPVAPEQALWVMAILAAAQASAQDGQWHPPQLNDSERWLPLRGTTPTQ